MTPSRRQLLTTALLAPFAAHASSSAFTAAKATTLPQHTAYLSHGTYKGVPYHLVVVDKPNGADLFGNVFADPYNKGGKLVENKVDGVLRAKAAAQIAPATAFALEPSAQLIFASNTTQNGYLQGVQIQDGKLYSDFDEPADNTPYGRAWHAIGFKRNGQAKIYEYGKDSGPAMVAEGVYNTMTFGVAAVIDGKAQKWLDGTGKKMLKDWDLLPSGDSLLVVSGRSIAGVDVHNRPMLLTTEGATGKWGLTIDEVAILAQSLGFHQAEGLDNGGSAQLYSRSSTIQASSDGRPRALPSWGYIKNVTVVEGSAPAPYKAIGGIGAYWRSTGGESKYGHPIESERTIVGGWSQRFSKGYTIYFSEPHGGGHLKDGTGFAQEYARNGKNWGLPVGGEYQVASTVAQTFSNRITAIWNPEHKVVYTLDTAGDFMARFKTGALGLPVSSEHPSGTGYLAHFAKGHSYITLIWSRKTEQTVVVNSRGALFHHWWHKYHNVASPLHDERKEKDGKIWLRLENGVNLSWTASSGVR